MRPRIKRLGNQMQKKIRRPLIRDRRIETESGFSSLAIHSYHYLSVSPVRLIYSIEESLISFDGYYVDVLNGAGSISLTL